MTLEKEAAEEQRNKVRAGGPSNLLVRFLSAIVLGPAFLAVVWYGDWAFSVAITVAGLLCLREWVTISAKAAHNGVLWAGHIGLLAAGLLAAGGSFPQALGIILVSCVLILIIGLVRTPAGATAESGLAGSRRAAWWTAAGLLYVGPPMVALLALRLGEQGLWAIVLVLAVTWATDIAAYFVGRTLGGPKLWPAVSPNKTWSGAIGGVVGAVSAAVAAVVVSGIGAPAAIGLVAVVLSVLSQCGDLAESAFKRHFGVKDSGDLIPGHGGIMDRIDGLVAAAIGAFLIGLAAAGGGDPSLGLMDL